MITTTYHLYLIQNEIAKKYFGREYMLYDLFSRFVQSSSYSQKKTLYKQIQFITEPLEASKLHYGVEQSLSFHPHYVRMNNLHILQRDDVPYGTLLIKRQCARITTTENYEVETMFFEILRKHERTLLAMNFIDQRYGWLNPVKQERKYV